VSSNLLSLKVTLVAVSAFCAMSTAAPRSFRALNEQLPQLDVWSPSKWTS
jgi:hypothetical protein